MGCRKIRMIGRVRIVLGFQAQRGMERIGCSALSLNGTVQEISAVKLNGWLVGKHTELASTAWIVEQGSFSKFAIFAIKHPVMIVAFAQTDLFIVCVDPLPDGCCFAEIKRSSCHGFQFTGWNQPRIDRRKARSIQS